MRFFKQIKLVYKSDFFSCFAFTLAAGLLVNIITDIVILVNPIKDTSLLHMGSVIALVMGAASIICISLFNNERFFILISANETRHRYFSQLIAARIIMAVGVVAISLLCFFLEQLKNNTIFSEYGFSAPNKLFGQPLILCLVMIMVVFSSVLLTACILRFGKIVRTLIAISPACLIILEKLFNRLSGTSVLGSLDNTTLIRCIIITVLSAVFFFTARTMILKQEVR